MVGGRDGASKGLNGFDPNAIGEGANAPDGSSPQLAGLVDELAQALGVARDSFAGRESSNDRRTGEPTPMSAAQVPSQSASSTLPVAIGRHLFDDEEDDAHMPIPSSWRVQPEPPKKTGSLNDQLRAAGLGFATGLALVVPVVLLLTGKFGDLPFSNALQTTPPAKRAAASTTYSPTVTFPASVSVPASVSAPTSAPLPTSAPATPPAPASSSAPTFSPAATPSSSPALPGTLVQAPPQRNVVAAVAPPKVEPPPPPPPAPSWTEAIAEGKQRILAGDIIGARDALTKAAAADNAEALLILAETYDPNMLAAWGARATADVAVAKSLYGRALAGGIDHARARIKALE